MLKPDSPSTQRLTSSNENPLVNDQQERSTDWQILKAGDCYLTHFGRPLPIGPLMKEHKLIELMIKNIQRKLAGKQGLENPVFAEAVLDFFRSYADRCHHGKEEDILFRELSKKHLSEQHGRIMNELIQEHCIARKTVARLEEAKNKRSQTELRLILCELVGLYPPHIEKEDKHFFYPVIEYFNQKELDTMIQEFKEFDRKMIHEEYEALAKSI